MHMKYEYKSCSFVIATGLPVGSLVFWLERKLKNSSRTDLAEKLTKSVSKITRQQKERFTVLLQTQILVKQPCVLLAIWKEFQSRLIACDLLCFC